MNEPFPSPDDPRLTAYALGELDGEERAAVELAVQRDPALQAAVAEIRALAGDLTEVLAAEPVAVAAVPSPALVPETETNEASDKAKRPAKIVRFPYFLISGFAAACFAVFVVIHESRSPLKGRLETTESAAPTLVEMNLAPMPAADAAVSDAVQFPATVSAAERTAEVETMARPLLEQIRVNQAQSAQVPTVTFSLPPTAPPAVPMELGAAGGGAAPVAGGAAPARDGSAAGLRARSAAPMTRAAYDTAAPEQATGSAESGAVTLSPFTVGSAEDRGYAATAGTVSGRAPGARSSWPYAPRVMPPFPEPAPLPSPVAHNTEAYTYLRDNAFVRVSDHPLSTFAVDVDTASYSNVRRFLQNGQRPPVDAVRIEELINYFPYRYGPSAAEARAPFAAGIEAAAAPWNPAHRLVRIGLKGRELNAANRPAANLVFLLDVSGSMNAPNRLPLVKESLRLLVDRLKPDDRVAIVTYAGQAGLALPSTPVSAKRDILAALEALRPGGSTQGSLGIHLAYDLARANFAPGGLNRVILCTDGDFNVGVTSQGELVRLVEEKARSGVFLTVLGFGMGNLKDAMLESLANRGNGVYGYIDTLREARKLLVEQVDGTLATIAKDVKIQVEFNPARVASYRLIGYENRLLNREDFDNDAVDAGEIGAGHTVTALYEIVPVDAAGAASAPAEPLRYQAAAVRPARVDPDLARELLTVKIRYKTPEGAESERLEFPFTDGGAGFADASADFKFAAAVAGFGMILRDSPHKGQASFDQVLTWAGPGLSDDAEGHRAEFVELVRRAREVTGG